MTRIAFRVDASREIGTGHFARCLTLARTLSKRCAEIRFLAKELPAALATQLADHGYEVDAVTATTPELDAAHCAAALGEYRPDWLVVDHYELDSRWETRLRPHCKQILVIDDKVDRHHDCDLLIDQNFNPEGHEQHRLHSPSHARFLFGPRYALLPAEFAAARHRRSVASGQVKRVLICFGGSDPGNHTAAAIMAIRPFAERLEHIDVVIGPLNPNRTEITTLCGNLPHAHLHSPANNMAELLLQADLAIGAGGTMNWERACLGIPSLAFGIADNQVAILAALIEAGIVGGQAAMPVGDSQSIARWIGIALENPSFLRGLSSRSRNLVDGHGAERVARHLAPLPLNFRPADQRDCDKLLRWRNSPEIRQASINTDEIALPTHRSWFLATLADPSRLLLIAESDGKELGVVRFDLAPPQASISVYRVPDALSENIGLIEQATVWLHDQHPEIRRVVAEVKQGNLASLCAFRAAGYSDNSTSLAIEWNHP